MTLRTRPLLTLLLAAAAALAPATAQITLRPGAPTVRDAAGRPLALAWLGGLNNPQPQAADLDGDGAADDLLIFDRVDATLHALRGDGRGHYTPAPALATGFPPGLSEWIVLRDADADGVTDLFAHDPSIDGIAYYAGHRTAEGTLAFTRLITDPLVPVLYYRRPGGGLANIFVSGVDYPSVEDVDQDGDLDIVTFNSAGGYAELFRNRSVEEGRGTDTLLFALEDDCYGGFYESGISTELDLAAGPDECAELLHRDGPRLSNRHAGSTVLNLDYDGDGLTDIMLGDISFRRMVLGLNGGSRRDAWINRQDDNWPTGGVTLDLPNFPAMFHLDADQDGARDLLASPQSPQAGEDVNVLWLYRNTGSNGSPEFNFVDSQYLLRDVIDVGTGALPAPFDYDGDGRTDLVVGNNRNYVAANFIDSRLRVYRNVADGPAGPVFALAETNWLDLAQFRNTGWSFAPAFGDLDGDGDADLVIGANTGKLFYGENTAGAGNPPRFAPLRYDYMGIDVGQFAKPHLADLDRDGLTDLIVGSFDSRIRFYRNDGTPGEARFDPDPAAPGNVLQLGGIDVRVSGQSVGYSTPWVLRNAAETLVLVGARSGRTEVYRLPAGTDYRGAYEPVTDTLGGVNVGGFAHPCFSDFDGDGLLECVIGTERGGLNYFTTNLSGDGTVPTAAGPTAAPELRVFPNPVADVLTVATGAGPRGQGFSLLDAAGRTVVRSGEPRLGVAGLPAGLYLLRVDFADGRFAVRRVVVR